jgi:choline/glycine/proline betaine transport protein
MSSNSPAAQKSSTSWKIDKTVFFGSVCLITIFIVLTLINIDAAEQVFTDIKMDITTRFGWLFNLSVQIFLFFVLYLAIGRFGQVRLGGDDCRPEHSLTSWFAMLFSAGMGIGLMFWSVAEPIFHFSAPPLGQGNTPQAAVRAFELTFLHWGFNAWAIYAVVGLTVAYKTFNKNRPLTISSAFYPLLGEKWVNSWPGKLIDITAVVATLFGVSTSLGFGASQINAGLNFVFGVPEGVWVKVAIIGGVTLLATMSVVSGLDKGVKRLSQINLFGALLLMLLVLIAGPTLFLLKSFVEHFGGYVSNLISLSSWNNSYNADDTWQSSWTIFYWAWWIAWSPFVGLFIARISKGRTIREFVLGVLLVPTLMTCLWINTFGGAALYHELFGSGGITTAVNSNVATSLFVLLEQYHIGQWVAVLAMFMVVIFFVTSADSGSLVIDYIASGGALNPPKSQRVFWALLQGTVAAVLLLGGGLAALQTAAIVTGLPFMLVLLFMCVALYKTLNQDFPLNAKISHQFHQKIDSK